MFPSEHVLPVENSLDICHTDMPAMKPDPLETAVVSHKVDECAVQRRTHDSVSSEKSASDKNSSPSPRNSDVIFESWDMVCMQFRVLFTTKVLS